MVGNTNLVLPDVTKASVEAVYGVGKANIKQASKWYMELAKPMSSLGEAW